MTTTPITPEQLATLLPHHAVIDTDSRHAAKAEWTTAGVAWSLSAHWHPTRPVKIAILGPAAAVILDDPHTEQIRQHLALLGAISQAAPQPAVVALFAERYIEAWHDGDTGQQQLLLHQLHTALNQHAGQS